MAHLKHWKTNFDLLHIKETGLAPHNTHNYISPTPYGGVYDASYKKQQLTTIQKEEETQQTGIYSCCLHTSQNPPNSKNYLFYFYEKPKQIPIKLLIIV